MNRFSLLKLPIFFALLFSPFLAFPEEKPPAPIEAPSQKELNEPLYPIDLNKLEKQNDRFFSELLSMLATLGLIIAFLLIVAWFLKKFMNTRLEQMNVSSKIKIVERRMLSQKSSLYVIEIEGRTYLISESHSGSSSIAALSAPPQPPKAFSELL